MRVVKSISGGVVSIESLRGDGDVSESRWSNWWMDIVRNVSRVGEMVLGGCGKKDWGWREY